MSEGYFTAYGLIDGKDSFTVDFSVGGGNMAASPCHYCGSTSECHEFVCGVVEIHSPDRQTIGKQVWKRLEDRFLRAAIVRAVCPLCEEDRKYEKELAQSLRAADFEPTFGDEDDDE